jgi:hypothetical protein
MAQDEVLRDWMGRELGRIRTDSSGKLEAFDRMGRRLGSYDPRSNRTYDQMGREVGQGNLLAALIWRAG